MVALCAGLPYGPGLPDHPAAHQLLRGPAGYAGQLDERGGYARHHSAVDLADALLFADGPAGNADGSAGANGGGPIAAARSSTATCSGSEQVQVPYAAEYWFYSQTF